MQKSRVKKEPDKKKAVIKSVKGAVFGLLVTVVSILVFAFIVKQLGMSTEAIAAVNQTIKVVSTFIAALIASRGVDKNGVMAGAMSGMIYVVLGYVTFSIIDGQFGDIMMMFADLAMGIVIGMLTAIIFGKFLVKKTA